MKRGKKIMAQVIGFEGLRQKLVVKSFTIHTNYGDLSIDMGLAEEIAEQMKPVILQALGEKIPEILEKIKKFK
jgi:hypothetical protein